MMNQRRRPGRAGPQRHNGNITGWHADRGIDEHRQVHRSQTFRQVQRQRRQQTASIREYR